MTKRICIGKITGPHGVKGLVKILPYCEDITLLEQVEDFEITLKNPSGKYMLAEIEGINTREAAEDIAGTELWISRDKLPDISDEDAFYIEDLVGLKAVDTDGKDAGTVIAVYNFGAGDLLEIKPPAGEAYLLPFTKDNVPEIEEARLIIACAE
ncbi:MAG: 16S rRNA processing protein RimM [Alphaproteobacteria bacterium]|nr:16S rRNA processing protein RimM [Alphaproteobacteria bacterium]